jgi:serine/threonine protein kinase
VSIPGPHIRLQLPFDDDYVPYLFKKIRGGIFSIPDHVSTDAADLVKSMLRVDPLNRITIDGIRDHAWFKIDCPEYLFPAADEEEVGDFDDMAVKEVGCTPVVQIVCSCAAPCLNATR